LSYTLEGMSLHPVDAAPTTLRERKKARTRREIATVAIELFRTRGYEGTTVEEIVRRVEISQPTFYKYYASKDAILREHAIHGWGKQLRALMQSSDSVEARLRRFFVGLAGEMIRDARLWRAIAISGAYNPALEPEVLRAEQAGTRALEELLQQGQDRGELSTRYSATRLAAILEGIMVRAWLEWGLGQTELGAADSVIDDSFAFFMQAART
jgi:AcrR family transcriptional regulator